MFNFLFAVNTASTTSMVFDNAPVYRYSMCNGTEYMFNECQLPVPDSDSTCPSFATVNCTEGLHNIPLTIVTVQIGRKCILIDKFHSCTNLALLIFTLVKIMPDWCTNELYCE